MSPVILSLLAITCATSLLLTPITRRIGVRFGLLDRPHERKLQKSPVPRTGGLGVLCGLVAGGALLATLSDAPRLSFGPQPITVLLGGLLIHLIGIWDDLQDLSAKRKLILQTFVVSAVMSQGFVLGRVDLPLVGSIELGIFAYTFVAREIAKDLGRQPDWVSVPVGNGTCIAGIWNGFRSMSMKPRMLGVSNNNSAVRGVVLGAEKEILVEDIRITETNEPLAGNVIFDAEEAMAAMVESNGGAAEVPDEELIRAAGVIKKEEGLDILPASAGAVWGISSLDSKNHVFVAVMTGKGHFGGE